MKVDCQWKRVVQRSLTNLNVLTVNGKDVGFIYKPLDGKPLDGKPLDGKRDRNAWRVHRGLGNDTDFVGYRWSKRDAQRCLESIFVGVCS
jgi:hypothetical protein